MIEYAYTESSDNEITEHRRLNLKLFYIRLSDRLYKHITPTYQSVYGVHLKNTNGGWFKNGNKYIYSADKRIEDYLNLDLSKK